jgi:chemosensory pili system protein ChpA (sensor histidine kinase/response regulator)
MRDDVDALIATDASAAQGVQTDTFDRLADNLGALSFLIDMLSVQPQMAKSLFRFDTVGGNLHSVMDRAQRPSGFGALEAPATMERSLLEQAESIAQKAGAPGSDGVVLARDLERLTRQAEAADQRGVASAASKVHRALLGAATDAERQQARTQIVRAMNNVLNPRIDAQPSQPAPLKAVPPPAPPTAPPASKTIMRCATSSSRKRAR